MYIVLLFYLAGRGRSNFLQMQFHLIHPWFTARDSTNVGSGKARSN